MDKLISVLHDIVSFFNHIGPFTSYMISEYGDILVKGIFDTLYMTFMATLVSYLFGLPIGVIAEVTNSNGIHPMPKLNKILGFIINIGRSIPFIILLVALMPFTREVIGTTIGPKAATVPLIIGAVPFVARLVENALKELDKGVIEAARSMGAGDLHIIFKVMIPETLPSLVLGISLACITLVGYTAMAGAVGGGGLGDIAIRYGYYRYQSDVMIVTIVLLVIIVQIIQSIGHFISKIIDKKN